MLKDIRLVKQSIVAMLHYITSYIVTYRCYIISATVNILYMYIVCKVALSLPVSL